MTIVKFDTDPCPCGSGLAIKECCVSLKVNTEPPPPKTNYSHPQCYARGLADCSERITGEHFVSKSVLRIISEAGPLKMVRAPWLPRGEEKAVSLATLPSKVLCKRHNEALSGLDQLAERFFNFLMGEKSDQEILMINGDEIERWMLKVLCGYVASGNSPVQSRSWAPPELWLHILFGIESIPPGLGLWFVKGDFKRIHHAVGLWAVPGEEANSITGIWFQISGFPFVFLMASFTPSLLESMKKELQPQSELRPVYRPELIQANYGPVSREVHFGRPEGEFVYVNASNRKG